MLVHLVDGTYELFRHHFAVPRRAGADGSEVGAVRGVLSSMLQLLGDGATHVGVATDHVIESWRNDLYGPYKDGSGIDPVLSAQFEPLEIALAAMGLTVWPQISHEADDAMAAASQVAAADGRVDRVLICTPDKDLAQCVSDDGRVVQYDRRKGTIYDRRGVIEKFGVPPESIPDWLALVGDSADGFPGLPGWGAKSAAAVLRKYVHIENIPTAPGQWDVPGLRGAAKLATTLQDQLADALLFRRIATLESEGVAVGVVDDWRWNGPTPAFEAIGAQLLDPGLVRRARALAAKRR